MAQDELMVYSSMALVPALVAVVGALVLRAVYRRTMSAPVSCLLFIAALPVGMFLSYLVVSAFSYLLHGDGALAIIAAPVTGAILTIPVALAFAVVLTVIRAKLDD
jgi:hypothetical protein